MHKQELAGPDIFVIHDFLSPAECWQHLVRCEEAGFDDAPIATGRGAVMQKDIRNNDRVIFDDVDLARDLWARAAPFFPPNFLAWVPVGLNERFRSYRYTSGQKFDWHNDGFFDRGNGERSRYTFMIYLNEGCDGGETIFNLRRLGAVRDGEELLRVAPGTGKALAFRHDVLHTGAVVTAGTKYVLRTDVMYRAAEPTQR
ncbi:2OG-Fe(II) oxygenase [Fimbriiglobus ruber]|uniref:WD-repeat protein n=1 Tax=Fimbriiglobus ruber TaxID=1908690 RepID=A0A225DKJ1_9BACT|nr:2OG-Fe(II) oxygenase [Fimbriiglobus ruber]OWK37699.1 WD-repeat protein [Fimbriiglobus ruber]